MASLAAHLVGLERYLLDAKYHIEVGNDGSALSYLLSALDELNRVQEAYVREVGARD